MKHEIPKFKLRLNIKSVMLYEQLTQKSFLRFEENQIENSLPLIYCMIAANNTDFDITYSDAVRYLFTDEKLVTEMMSKLQKEMDFNNQFQGYEFLFKEDYDIEETEQPKQPQNKDKEKRPLYISEMVPALVKDCGLSIEYVLYTPVRDKKPKENLVISIIFRIFVA